MPCYMRVPINASDDEYVLHRPSAVLHVARTAKSMVYGVSYVRSATARAKAEPSAIRRLPYKGAIMDRVPLHGDAELADLHVWQIGPEARAAIVSVRAKNGVTTETIRERLVPVHEVMHLTVEAVR